MCTMIAKQVPFEASGKGRDDWFEVRQLNVSYDHPYHARDEHALNIDFVNEGQGPGARVGVGFTPEGARWRVKLPPKPARKLTQTINEILTEAEAAGHIPAEK